jgi:hypothetical protein
MRLRVWRIVLVMVVLICFLAGGAMAGSKDKAEKKASDGDRKVDSRRFKSEIDRKDFKKERENYWKERAKDFK